MGKRKVDIALTSFTPDPNGELEFGKGRAENLDTRDFGQIVLEERFVKGIKGRSISGMNKNPDKDNQMIP